jgi:heme exporter protein A
MLLVNNLRFERSGKVIFENINISASPGKIVFIKGDNGTGKTTLLKTLVNILRSNEGDIFWMGKKIKNNIFNFYQETTFIMDQPTSTLAMTVIENINFWKKISSSKIKYEEIFKLLEMLRIDQYLKKQTMYLSLGEIKKLELTRLIVEQKKLWILDEPYIGLDKNSVEIINETFVDHVSKNGIIIFSSNYEPDLKNLDIISLN